MTNATAIDRIAEDKPQFTTVTTPRALSVEPDVVGFYDPATGSIQYIVADPITRKCAVIDPVLDFEPKSGSTRTTSADQLLSYIEAHGLTLEWILDTHPHADHFSAGAYLKSVTGASTGIGERVKEVQRLWRTLYNLPDSFPMNTAQWDHLFADGERFAVGELDASVLLSPGHTLASVTYIIGNAAFVHDTIFMPDSGTARADFREEMPGSYGEASRKSYSCRRRRVFLPAMTIVQTAEKPGGKAGSLRRRRTIAI
jgi:glyoxylase-like metal-dependent hydrolase (beta-lactamase superfamily II)